MAPEPRKGMPSPQLDEPEFRARYLEQFADPAFDAARGEIDRIAAIAWDGYSNHRKAPVTRKAGAGYADPDYDLSVDWIAAKEQIDRAQAEHDDTAEPPCILIVNGSPRSEHTCPGEMSKSWRMIETGAGDLRGRRHVGANPRPVAPHLRIWPQHPSLQGLLLDRRGAVPLAVQLLPQPQPRPDPGLDERHLSAVGPRPWHHDRHAGQLVLADLAAEADDGPAGVRRRRQSRPVAHPRQGCETGQAARARRLALSAPPRKSRLFGGRPWRRRGRRRMFAAASPTGCVSCI